MQVHRIVGSEAQGYLPSRKVPVIMFLADLVGSFQPGGIVMSLESH